VKSIIPPPELSPQKYAPPHGTRVRTTPSALACPHCGQPQGFPLDPQLSALLDWLESIDETLHAVRAVVEEVLP